VVLWQWPTSAHMHTVITPPKEFSYHPPPTTLTQTITP